MLEAGGPPTPRLRRAGWMLRRFEIVDLRGNEISPKKGSGMKEMRENTGNLTREGQGSQGDA